MSYVDGYVLAIPKSRMREYFQMARKAGKVFLEHGALEYRECAGDDLNIKGMASFPKAVKSKPGETIVFSWVVFKSKSDRDKINAKVREDPRLAPIINQSAVLFNPKRMIYGGFKVIVKF